MITANISEGEVTIKFNHERMLGQRFTACMIGGAVEASGIAMCSRGDNFCRAIGRKVALKRAIKNLPRPERTKIWQAYFRQIGGAR